MRCGRSVSTDAEYCNDCLSHAKSFERVFAVWNYDDVMQSSIASYKYHGRQEYADYYSAEVLRKYRAKFTELKPDAVIPVPVHADRLAKRGYNQAEFVAKRIAEELNVPCITDLLVRSVNTAPQKELSPEERAKNIRQAFGINKKSKAYRYYLGSVLLVDDIYTTGSTANACASVLRESGVGSVYVVCLCAVEGQS